MHLATVVGYADENNDYCDECGRPGDGAIFVSDMEDGTSCAECGNIWCDEYAEWQLPSHWCPPFEPEEDEEPEEEPDPDTWMFDFDWVDWSEDW